MPGPIRAPERPTAKTRQPLPTRRPEREHRLRRTLAATAVVVLVLVGWLISRSRGAVNPVDAPPASANQDVARVRDAPARAADPPAVAAGEAKPSPAPEPTSVPASGDGKITVLRVPGNDTGRPGRAVRFSVEAEGGLGLDLASFAADVRDILSDERGWEVEDGIHFVAVSPDKAKAGASIDIRVTLASPRLTDRLCAPLNTRGEVSCNRGGRAVINAKRWVKGVDHYDSLTLYRTYLINHEVGHGLWHPHVVCAEVGRRAPIMLQQTLGLQGCTAWPYPKAD